MGLKRSKGATPGFGSTPLTVAARMTRTTDQSISATTSTVLAMTNTDFVVGGMVTDTATGKFTVPFDGVYLLSTVLPIHTGGITDFRIRPSVNGSLLDQWIARDSINQDRTSGGSILLSLSAGNTVQIEVYGQAAFDIYGAMFPHMALAKL